MSLEIIHLGLLAARAAVEKSAVNPLASYFYSFRAHLGEGQEDCAHFSPLFS